ncbi:hypothetical protein SUGI_0607090 [Cryptomeria japonica]|nr:hypothetical protein SUGI_0607090 [Cryptomeria japonica]
MALRSCLKPPRTGVRVSFSLSSFKDKVFDLRSRQNWSALTWKQGSKCAAKNVLAFPRVMTIWCRGCSDEISAALKMADAPYGGHNRARDATVGDGHARWYKAASVVQGCGSKTPPHTVKQTPGSTQQHNGVSGTYLKLSSKAFSVSLDAETEEEVAHNVIMF